MNQTLATYLKMAFVMVLVISLFMGICYQTLSDKSHRYHSKLEKYQVIKK
jgi:hypothetical protein